MAVSKQGDLLVQANHRGARSLLQHPVKLEELAKELRKIDPQPNGKFIAFLGSRGGVGCTSLAINLACTLAKDSSNQVCLVDLDLVQGDADVALNLSPAYRLIDVVLNLDRIDLQFLQDALSKHSTGLALLPRPELLQEIGQIHDEALQRIFRLLPLKFTHLIVDLSKGWTTLDVMSMGMADVILLIFQLELSSLRNAVLMLKGKPGALADRVQIVVNRVGAQVAGEGITLNRAEEVLGRSVYWEVPNDSLPILGG